MNLEQIKSLIPQLQNTPWMTVLEAAFNPELNQALEHIYNNPKTSMLLGLIGVSALARTLLIAFFLPMIQSFFKRILFQCVLNTINLLVVIWVIPVILWGDHAKIIFSTLAKTLTRFLLS